MTGGKHNDQCIKESDADQTASGRFHHADADHLLDAAHEDLAVADLAVRRLDDGSTARSVRASSITSSTFTLGGNRPRIRRAYSSVWPFCGEAFDFRPVRPVTPTSARASRTRPLEGFDKA